MRRRRVAIHIARAKPGPRRSSISVLTTSNVSSFRLATAPRHFCIASYDGRKYEEDSDGYAAGEWRWMTATTKAVWRMIQLEILLLVSYENGSQ